MANSHPDQLSMKAAIWTNYGGPEVLQLETVPVPEPRADEILVRIAAANIFTGDAEMRQFKMHPSLWLLIRLFMGVFKPRIKVLGQEFSGTVVASGADVDNFAVGDEVFGSTGARFGAYAEYIALPASYPIIHKPEDISHLTATTIPVGGVHALHFLRLAELQAGQEILIVGACGCIGTFAVQLAKRWGAIVTAIDSAEKLATLKDLGADRVIDYDEVDFTQEDKQYDVIFDIVGSSPFGASLCKLKPDGCYLLANVGLWPMLRAAITSRVTDKRIFTKLARITESDLHTLCKLVSEKSLKTSIDGTYRLEEVVEAHRYIDTGKKKGHVTLIFKTATDP